MVAVPRVKFCLACVWGNRSHLVERGRCMVCLPDSVLVKWLKIHSTAMFARLLPLGYHSGAPSHGGAHRDWLNYTKPHILIKPSFNFILGVHRDWYRCVKCHRLSVRVHHEAHWGTTHHWQRLVLAYIKCARGVVVDQPLLKLASVPFRRRVGKLSG